MKEKFINKRFRAESLRLIDIAETILDDYERQGYDLSLRQLYYQFVARNIIPNNEKSYNNLGNLISDARMAGLLDWDMIRDRGREVIEGSYWGNPEVFLKSAARAFTINKWQDQENHVEVMVEKQALEGVLIPVCEELQIPFTANKGYTSSSALYESSRRWNHLSDDNKNIHIIYLGDRDPSGIDMTRDVRDRSLLFSDNVSTTFNVHRIALNMPQIKEFKPPENPAKMTDSRAAEYIIRYGKSSWELDAIEPSKLAQLVRDKVLDLRDPDKWAEQEKQKTDMRNALIKAANNLDY